MSYVSPANIYWFTGFEAGAVGHEWATDTGGTYQTTEALIGSGARRKRLSGATCISKDPGFNQDWSVIQFMVDFDTAGSSADKHMCGKLVKAGIFQRRLGFIRGTLAHTWHLYNASNVSLASVTVPRGTLLNDIWYIIWQFKATAPEYHVIDIFHMDSTGVTGTDDNSYLERTPKDHARLVYTSASDISTIDRFDVEANIISGGKSPPAWAGIMDDAVALDAPVARLGVLCSLANGNVGAPDNDWEDSVAGGSDDGDYAQWNNIPATDSTFNQSPDTGGTDRQMSTMQGSAEMVDCSANRGVGNITNSGKARLIEGVAYVLRHADQGSITADILPTLRISGETAVAGSAVPDSTPLKSNDNFWWHKQTPEAIPTRWTPEKLDNLEAGVTASGASATNRKVSNIYAMVLFQQPYIADCGFY